ncbi:MAG TPA: SH3 domain-containing protein, partial [Pyrinomonadaceae bacterium]|nr:SH3 domain-containing protein [Pyrinomonadaceae bacterium]
MAHYPARVKKLFAAHATKLLSTLTSRLLITSAASFALTLALATHAPDVFAKGRRRPPSVGGAAVVVDERLSALRDAPGLSANLLQRLGRGRYVSVTGERRTREGVTFLRVAVTSRTSGWVQSEALARPSRAGEDARLLRLIRGSGEFDRLARARIFLEAFPRTPLRPAVLLL